MIEFYLKYIQKIKYNYYNTNNKINYKSFKK